MTSWKPWLRVALLALLASELAPAREAGTVPARAAEQQRRVEVRVVEVAGGRAYLAPGAEQNVRVGDRVRVGSGDYVVVARNAKTFAIESDVSEYVRSEGTIRVVALRLELRLHAL